MKHGANKSHDTKDCKALKREKEATTKDYKSDDITCYNCNKTGHYANKCPRTTQQQTAATSETNGSLDNLFELLNDSDDETCASSGGAHPTSIFIPVAINGIRTQAFVDSGSSCSMIHPQLADKLQLERHDSEPIGTWAKGQTANTAMATSPVTIASTNGTTTIIPRIAPINVGAPLLLGRNELQALGIGFTGLPLDYPSQPQMRDDIAWDPEARPSPIMNSTPQHAQP